MLKSRKGKVRHLQTTLVEVAKVQELSRQRKPGRPRKPEGQPAVNVPGGDERQEEAMRKTLKKAGLPLPAKRGKRK